MRPGDSQEIDARTKQNPAPDPTIDETLALQVGDTVADFDDLLRQAKNVRTDSAASEQQCIDLIDRLKDVNQVRQLARSLETSESSSLVPEKLGQFELLESLGSGGMGQVFRARHSRLGRIQAVKVLHEHRLSDVNAVARFQQEMRAIGQLQHPNIVSAQHADEVDGIPYLVMEYVDGQSLFQLAKRLRSTGDRLSVAAACELLRQTAIGIQYAHEQGVFHRDIKPGNIMLDQFGAVRILDLGLARIVDKKEEDAPELTSEQQILGTLDYMAPEQILSSRDVDARTDVYALGATLYFLLTGQVIFPADKSDSTMNKGMRILNDSVQDARELREDIPPELAELLSSCLKKDPQQRLQTAGELAQRLGQWASADSLNELTPDSLSSVADPEDLTDDRTEPQAAHVTPHAQDDKRPPTRYRFAIALAGLIPLLLLAGVIFRLQFPDGGELLVECDDPNAQITVSAVQGDISETLELSKQPNGSLTLTAGTWQLSIEGLDADSFRLSENQIVMSSSSGNQTLTVTRKPAPKPSDIPLAMTPVTQPKMSEQRTGSLKGIETESRWQLGPGYPSVRGLLPQPAELPGIGRWNIRNRLTGASLMRGAAQQEGALATLDPSGRFLVVSHPTTTYISEVETGNIVRVLPLPEGIEYTAFVSATRNAKRVAMLVRLGRVLIWDQRNRVAFDWELDASLYQSGPASGETPGLRWMPDGQRLLIWSSKKAQVVEQDGTVVYSADFSENEGPCCFGRTLLNVVPEPVSVSSTGNAVAFGCSDARIRVWTPATGEWTVFEPIAYDTNFKPMFVSLAWSPDDSRLVSGFLAHTQYSVRIWKADGTLGLDLGSRPPWGLCWSPNGRYLVTGLGEILHTDGETELVRKLPSLNDSATTAMVTWQPFWLSDNRIDFVAHSGNSIRATGQMRAYSPTGRALPIAKQRNPLQPVGSAWVSEGGSLMAKYRIGWVDRTANELSRFQTFGANGDVGDSFDVSDPKGQVMTLADRGGRFWTLEGSNNILIYDNRGKQIGNARYENGEKPLATPGSSWSPDQSQFAVPAYNDNDSFVDLLAPDGTRKQRLELSQAASYQAFSWSPDGKSLAMTGSVADGKGILTIWNPEASLVPVIEVLTPTTAPGDAIVWSPDSIWLAAFGAPTPENKASFLRLIHLPSQRVFEPDGMYTYREIPFWLDNTHVQTGNRLIEVSTESSNGIVRMEILPFEVELYLPFVVPGITASQSVVYRPKPGMPGRSDLEIWTHKNRVASIPLNAQLRTTVANQPTSEGLCLLEFHDSPSVAVLDLKQQALRFIGISYDDGQSLSLSPSGQIIDGPDDVEPYLMYIIQYPGGAEVALTRTGFHARIGLDASQQAVNWVLDIGGAVRLRDTENWLTRSDIPVSDSPPNPNQIIAVDLSSCKFSSAESIPRLATLPLLTELLMNGSVITDTDSLSGCKSLQSLDLSDTAIDSISGLTDMPELRTLNLSGTRVRSDIGVTLVTLLGLEEIDLSKTAVDEFVLADLGQLKQLRKLNLTGLKIPDDAVARLRAKLPECRTITGVTEGGRLEH